MAVFFTLFVTPIGACGLAWGERGVAGVQLPEASETAARARLARYFPGAAEAAPFGEPKGARDAIVSLLGGEPADLSAILLDMDGLPPFHRRVYAAARTIPFGKTTTYGALAKRIGAANSARAAGQALARNPFPILVPCHRVVAAGKRSGGFSAYGGVATKLRLLAIEGGQEPGALGAPAALDERPNRFAAASAAFLCDSRTKTPDGLAGKA